MLKSFQHLIEHDILSLEDCVLLLRVEFKNEEKCRVTNLQIGDTFKYVKYRCRNDRSHFIIKSDVCPHIQFSLT